MVLSGTVERDRCRRTGCGWADLARQLAVGDDVKTTCDARIALPASPMTIPGPDTREPVAAQSRGALNVLDLDFTPEQEMLRQPCVASSPAMPALGRARARRRPDRVPAASCGSSSASSTSSACSSPRSYGGSAMTPLEGVVLYEELGRVLGPGPALRERGALGWSARARRQPAQKDAWLPAIVSGEAILTPAWLEPEQRLLAPGGADPGPTRRDGVPDGRHEAPRGVSPRRPTGWSFWHGPGTAQRTSICSWSIPKPPACPWSSSSRSRRTLSTR